MSFKIGDRVRVTEVMDKGYSNIKVGDTGTIKSYHLYPAVEFDRNINGHNCSGKTDDEYGWYIVEDQIAVEKINKDSLSSSPSLSLTLKIQGKEFTLSLEELETLESEIKKLRGNK